MGLIMAVSLLLANKSKFLLLVFANFGSIKFHCSTFPTLLMTNNACFDFLSATTSSILLHPRVSWCIFGTGVCVDASATRLDLSKTRRKVPTKCAVAKFRFKLPKESMTTEHSLGTFVKNWELAATN